MRKEIVFELIRNSPGISYNEIVRKTNLSNGVISHYLIKLLESKEVEKEGIKRGKYFLKSVTKKDRLLITLLRNKTNNDIFRLLIKSSNEDMFTAKEISKKIKKSNSTVSVSLKTMQHYNVIERVIMNKSQRLTNDLAYRIFNKKLWNTYHEKYNL